MSYTLHTEAQSQEFPTLIGAMQAMRKAKQPCCIEGPEVKGSSSAWEKWSVRTPHMKFMQYVSPDGEVTADDDEFDVIIENMKEALLDGVSMS